MESLWREVEGAMGGFFWFSPGDTGDFLGPIVPSMFAVFRLNASDRAILMGRHPSSTLLVWVCMEEAPPSGPEARPRVLGKLPEMERWSQCVAWADALAEQAELAKTVPIASAMSEAQRL